MITEYTIEAEVKKLSFEKQQTLLDKIMNEKRKGYQFLALKTFDITKELFRSNMYRKEFFTIFAQELLHKNNTTLLQQELINVFRSYVFRVGYDILPAMPYDIWKNTSFGYERLVERCYPRESGGISQIGEYYTAIRNCLQYIKEI